jgi:hypothetical protein
MARNGHLREKMRRRHRKHQPVLAMSGLDLLAAKRAAAQDALPITEEDQTDLSLAYRLSFEMMLTGDSTEEHWSTVVCSLNTALVLAERTAGTNHEEYLVRALDGAWRARERAQKTGVWRFDGPAINDIRIAFEIHEEQIQFCNRQQIRAALQEVSDRIVRGNTYREVV